LKEITFMNFTDSHAHICAPQFKSNWKNIVTEANNAGVSTIINIGDNLDEGEWAIQQANQTNGLFATVGIHPAYIQTIHHQPLADWLNNLRRLLTSSPKVVGLGEIGLDATLAVSREDQVHLLTEQLRLALDLQLPVVLHVRDVPSTNPQAGWVWPTIIHTMEKFSTLQAVYHCWTGPANSLADVITLGHYVSFSGILTYPNAEPIVKAASSTPLNRILIETDAPYLIPEPKRTQLRQLRQKDALCLPGYVTMTAQALADLRQISLPEVAEHTTANTQKLFRLP
jgi:TatD DNase family protein